MSRQALGLEETTGSIDSEVFLSATVEVCRRGSSLGDSWLKEDLLSIRDSRQVQVDRLSKCEIALFLLLRKEFAFDWWRILFRNIFFNKNSNPNSRNVKISLLITAIKTFFLYFLSQCHQNIGNQPHCQNQISVLSQDPVFARFVVVLN